MSRLVDFILKNDRKDSVISYFGVHLLSSQNKSNIIEKSNLVTAFCFFVFFQLQVFHSTIFPPFLFLLHFNRVIARLDSLTASLIAWKQFESGLDEFKEALGKDKGALKGLSGALEMGGSGVTVPNLAHDVKEVAKRLSEKMNNHVVQQVSWISFNFFFHIFSFNWTCSFSRNVEMAKIFIYFLRTFERKKNLSLWRNCNIDFLPRKRK